MWQHLAVPWQACLEEAWVAYRAGSLPIGAVVTDREGRIIARGRNRIFEAGAEGRHIYGHRLAHAEVNALNALDYATVDPTTCVLYTTTEPCPLCTGAIRVTRLRAVHYASHDPAGGSVDLFQANSYMRRSWVRVHGPEDRALEAVIMALHVVRGLERPQNERAAWQCVLEAWAAVVPAGVALGQALYASGELRSWAEAGQPIGAVIDRLVQRGHRAG